jgi:hypothetical protein
MTLYLLNKASKEVNVLGTRYCFSREMLGKRSNHKNQDRLASYVCSGCVQEDSTLAINIFIDFFTVQVQRKLRSVFEAAFIIPLT